MSTSSQPQGAAAIRIYLVDDQAMIRAAIRSLLSRERSLEVVGESGDARHAVDEIKALAPDIVLLDITMPELSGLDAITRILGVARRTRVIMLTNHEAETFVEQALRLGASGYLSKDSDPAELCLAIRSVHRGDAYVSPKVASALVTRYRHGGGDVVAPTGRVDSLTPREREVFQLLAVGRSNKEVARELEMSLGTAKKHRENLQRKLDCHSAAELARLAIREGLLNL